MFTHSYFCHGCFSSSGYVPISSVMHKLFVTKTIAASHFLDSLEAGVFSPLGLHLVDVLSFSFIFLIQVGLFHQDTSSWGVSWNVQRWVSLISLKIPPFIYSWFNLKYETLFFLSYAAIFFRLSTTMGRIVSNDVFVGWMGYLSCMLSCGNDF